MVGNLGCQSARRGRAGTGDLRGADDLPMLTHGWYGDDREAPGPRAPRFDHVHDQALC